MTATETDMALNKPEEEDLVDYEEEDDTVVAPSDKPTGNGKEPVKKYELISFS